MIDCSFTADEGNTVKKINDIFDNVNAKQADRTFKSRLPHIAFKAQQQPQTLRKIVLQIDKFYVEKGQKVCVIGKEGSGKDYFFLSIMAELKKETGIFKRNGKIVYLDMDNQKFLKGTIRENITLGEEYLADKFKEIC